MMTRAIHKRRLVALILAAVASIGLLPAVAGAAPDPVRENGTTKIQILQYSDWHGQLDPLAVGTAQFGGAPILSTYFKQDEAANPNTLIITGGDDFGAAPPLASFFDEVPAVLAQNLMGTDVGGLGNHNFDGGIAELQSLIDIADYSYVSANLANVDANLSGVKPYEIFKFSGVKVAVIGVTNPEAPTLVFPGNFGTIEITDPVAAANAARERARTEEGAKVFILVGHMGVRGFDAAGAPFGELIDLANGVSGFDLVLGDHTDVQYSGVHNGALVTEARSKGLNYARIELTVKLGTGEVLDTTHQFVSPAHSSGGTAVTPDQAIVDLLAPYRAALAPILNAGVGSATRAIPRTDSCGRADGRLCESLVGNVVTDAMRTRYGTDFAITNSGGLRASLTCPTTDSATDFCPAFTPPPYPITRGQVLTVLPFGNVVATVTVNGAELKGYLENGVSSMPGANGRFAQVSGLCFTYNISAAAGSRVTAAVRQAADGSCTGAAIDLSSAGSYTVAINDFMGFGGDGYQNLSARMVTREIMDQVLADYVIAGSPISPSIQGRIVCTTSGAPACPVVVP
jgi:2',3'-cyclic-nucleotide 2'-phosphodiesterase (5'-nucleotidase family)